MSKEKIDFKLLIPALLLGAVGVELMTKFDPLGFGLWFTLILVVTLFLFLFRNPLAGASALIFFLPFEKFPTLIIGGIDWRLNHLVGLLLVAISLAYAFIKPKAKVSFGGLGWLSILLAFSLLLSLGVAVDQSRAIMVLGFVYFMLLVFLSLIYLIDTKEKLWQVIRVLFVSCGVVVAFAFFQFAGDMAGIPSSVTLLNPAYTHVIFGFPRVHVFSQEPLYLGNYLLLPVGVGLAFLISKSRLNRSWLALITGVGAAIIILTMSRGAILGLVGAAVVIGILFFRKVIQAKNLLRTVGIGLLAALIVSGIFYRLDPSLGEKFLNQILVKDYGRSESTQGRLNSFENAYNLWQDNPVRGIGLGNYGPWLVNYPSEPKGRGWDIVNNQYLELLAETGVIGFGAFMLLLTGLYWLGIKAFIRTTDEALKALIGGLLAAVTGILIQYNFFSTLYIFHIWAAFGLLAAASLVALREQND